MKAMTKTLTKLSFVHRLGGIFGRISPFFRRLQWKLTLAYTLFTLTTILLLVGIALAFLWYLNFRSNTLPQRIADGLLRAGPSMAPYLEQTPPDQKGLNQWLQSVTQDNNLVINVLRDDAKDENDKVPAQFGRVVVVAIVDTEGKLLAAVPADTAELGVIFEDHLSPLATDGFQAALKGETAFSALATRDSEGHMVATVPIFGPNNHLLGAIHATLAFPIAQAEFLQLVLQGTILPVAVMMLLTGVVAGLLFGYLIARGLTRRLRVLDQAADAWSRGNFDILALDYSGDELGQLARHFNTMALQLENLLHTQQELATLEERNRLARDLHDSVKQQIFATAMQVGAARALIERDPEEARTHLEEADQLVRQAQRELTTLIQELRPAALEGRGLAKALQDYLTDWSRQTDIAGELRVSGERSLALSLEQTLFRIAQEALANVARHSHATATEVFLGWKNSTVTLIVSDDGGGFSINTINGEGMGLQSMRERIETLAGSLTIESSPQVGTRVTVQVDTDINQGK